MTQHTIAHTHTVGKYVESTVIWVSVHTVTPVSHTAYCCTYTVTQTQ